MHTNKRRESAMELQTTKPVALNIKIKEKH